MYRHGNAPGWSAMTSPCSMTSRLRPGRLTISSRVHFSSRCPTTAETCRGSGDLGGRPRTAPCISVLRSTTRHTCTPEQLQEAQRPLGWAYRTAYCPRPASDFRSRRESDFLEVSTVPYTLLPTLLPNAIDVKSVLENFFKTITM